MTQCFHCDLPIIDATPKFYAKVSGIERPMCCPGCKAITETIILGGLGDYYQYRTEPALKPNIESKVFEEYLVYDDLEVQKTFVRSLADEVSEASFLIEGITCSACMWLIEKHLQSCHGIVKAQVNLSEQLVNIQWYSQEVVVSTIFIQLNKLGYPCHPWRIEKQQLMLKEERRQFTRRLAVAGIGATQVMMYAIALYAGALQDMDVEFRSFIRWVSALVALPVVAYAAQPFFIASFKNLKNRTVGMNVPISIAVASAYIVSIWSTWSNQGEVYFDSICMFTFFLLLGRYAELRARHRRIKSGHLLHNLIPVSCVRILDHTTERVVVQSIKVGNSIRIFPGDNIPVDGVILNGTSRLNKAVLTGEYCSVRCKKGDVVLAGSINMENTIDVKVAKVGNETELSAILRLLERAQMEKPAIASMADKVAGAFVAFVLLASSIVFVIWYQIAPENALSITLSVLVVTCPCALSLATPVALASATASLQKMGILITRSHVLEGLNRVSRVVFDKTGTLTKGLLKLQECKVLSGCSYSCENVMQIASSLESYSEHPISGAFETSSVSKVSCFRYTVGQGIEGYINGKHFTIGRPGFGVDSFYNEHSDGIGVETPKVCGKWLILCEAGKPLAWFCLGDQIRSESATIISECIASGIGVELLSGDNESVVSSVASELGIKYFQAEASPTDKFERICELQRQGEIVLMVGDGVNDVPVLSKADISIAMHNTTELAKMAGDAVLMSQDLSSILSAFAMAKKTRHVIIQNMIWAFIYNMTALPLAATGMLPPWLAAIGMSCSSLFVVANSTRLSITPASSPLTQQNIQMLQDRVVV